jgi:serine/threonine-protein kinase SRPK3
MDRFFRLGLRFLSRAPSPPRVISHHGFTTLDPTVRIEEEKMPAYEKGLFYPVKLGEVFNDRYQALGKLGFGANSTVWFCRDLKYWLRPLAHTSLLTDRKSVHIAM